MPQNERSDQKQIDPQVLRQLWQDCQGRIQQKHEILREDKGFELSYPTLTCLLRELGISLCESAIDAISCFVLYPDYCCISTAGARPDPRWLAEIILTTIAVFCGFDADPTGDTMAQAMMARHPAIPRLRPPRPDWNDTLRTPR